MYLRSGWNQLDVVCFMSVSVAMALRLLCVVDDVPLAPNATAAANVSRDGALDLADDGPFNQCIQEVYSRNLYSLIMFLLYWKLLSYAEYNEMIGASRITRTRLGSARGRLAFGVPPADDPSFLLALRWPFSPWE